MAPFLARFLGFRLVVVDPGFISSNNSYQKAITFFFKAFQKFLADINTSFFQFCGQLAWHPPCTHFMELQNIMNDMVCWSMTHVQMCGCFMQLRGDFPSQWLQLLKWPLVSLLGMPDLVEESLTELTPFRNFLLHLYTCCSDRQTSPYWTSIRRWISMGFTPSLRKKRMTERCSSLVHVASGTAILHYCCAVVLHSSIVLPPVGHSSNHEYHCCQLTGQSSSV